MAGAAREERTSGTKSRAGNTSKLKGARVSEHAKRPGCGALEKKRQRARPTRKGDRKEFWDCPKARKLSENPLAE